VKYLLACALACPVTPVPKFFRNDVVIVHDYKWSPEELFERCDKVANWRVMNILPGKRGVYQIDPAFVNATSCRLSVVIDGDNLTLVSRSEN